MRLNIDNIDPKVIGLIYEDKARHKHSTLADTVECLVKRAMEIEPPKKIEQVSPTMIETIEKVVKKVLGKQNKEDVVVEEKEMAQKEVVKGQEIEEIEVSQEERKEIEERFQI